MPATILVCTVTCAACGKTIWWIDKFKGVWQNPGACYQWQDIDFEGKFIRKRTGYAGEFTKAFRAFLIVPGYSLMSSNTMKHKARF